MRDWNNDGFADPVPDGWRDYTGGGCGCSLVLLVVVIVVAYLLLNA